MNVVFFLLGFGRMGWAQDTDGEAEKPIETQEKSDEKGEKLAEDPAKPSEPAKETVKQTSMDSAFEKKDWAQVESLFLELKTPSYQQHIMAGFAALEIGNAEAAYFRFQRAIMQNSGTLYKGIWKRIQSQTHSITIKGRKKQLIFAGDSSPQLLKFVAYANTILEQQKIFQGRLPYGFYQFGEKYFVLNSSGKEDINKETFERGVAEQKKFQESFQGQVLSTVDLWLEPRTRYSIYAGMQGLHFGSDGADVAMQSAWSYGPMVGMMWEKQRDDWLLGVEADVYITGSTRAFLLGLSGNAFGGYTGIKGSVLAGLRYDFAFGRIAGVKMREQEGTITEEELNAVVVPGVALSLGPWIGYRYPIIKELDAMVRTGFRHDGKRIYFDVGLGANYKFPL